MNNQKDNTIKLEIGPNLYKAIEQIVDASTALDIGTNIKNAFGIDFGKMLKKGKYKVEVK